MWTSALAQNLCRCPLNLFSTYSGLLWRCTQTGVLEPAEDVLRRHLSKDLAQRIVKLGPRPGLGPSESLLDLRDHLLHRGVVRTIRWQRQDPRASVLNRRRHLGTEVRLEVV